MTDNGPGHMTPGAPTATAVAAPGSPAPAAAAAGAAGRVAWRGLIEAYREWLPVEPGVRVITLNEGATPLLPAPVLSAMEAVRNVDSVMRVEGVEGE